MWLKYLLPYTYLFFKHYLSMVETITSIPTLLITFSLLLTTISLPFIVLFLLICWTYKIIIISILKWKLKDNFVMAMPGLDKFMCISPNCTPCMFLFVNTENKEELLIKLRAFWTKHKAERNPRSEKIFYSWDKYMGHHYYYKNNLTSEDYIRLIDADKETDKIIRTKQDLAELILRYDSDPLPDNDSALIGITIYPNKIELSRCENTTLVGLKMHHCLGDAKAITGWVMAELADQKESHVTNGSANDAVKARNENNAVESGRMVDKLKKVLFDEKIKEFPSDMKDRNILRGYDLREERFVCWFSDQSDECMKKIKAIRQSVPGVTFLDVVNTCITSSFYDFYQKNCSEVPKKVAAGVVLSPAKYCFKYGEKNYKLNNEFSCAGFYLPIVTKENSVLERLQLLKQEYDEVKQSVDVKFNFWLGDKVLDLVPYQLIVPLTNSVEITAGISSIPGPECFSILGGLEIKDMVLMPPNSPGTGLHFVICSYGHKFRLSVTVDRSVIEDFNEAQSVIDGALKYLDVLHEKTKTD